MYKKSVKFTQKFKLKYIQVKRQINNFCFFNARSINVIVIYKIQPFTVPNARCERISSNIAKT